MSTTVSCGHVAIVAPWAVISGLERVANRLGRRGAGTDTHPKWAGKQKPQAEAEAEAEARAKAAETATVVVVVSVQNEHNNSKVGKEIETEVCTGREKWKWRRKGTIVSAKRSRDALLMRFNFQVWQLH